MTSRFRWSVLGILFIIVSGFILIAKGNEFKRQHTEFSLSGQALYNTYCIKCHMPKKIINKHVMSEHGNYMILDDFGRTMMVRHKNNFNQILFESDIEPLYRYLSESTSSLEE